MFEKTSKQTICVFTWSKIRILLDIAAIECRTKPIKAKLTMRLVISVRECSPFACLLSKNSERDCRLNREEKKMRYLDKLCIELFSCRYFFVEF